MAYAIIAINVDNKQSLVAAENVFVLIKLKNVFNAATLLLKMLDNYVLVDIDNLQVPIVLTSENMVIINFY